MRIDKGPALTPDRGGSLRPVTPPRETRHEETNDTIAFLSREGARSGRTLNEIDYFAHAMQCVREVAALHAENARLAEQAEAYRATLKDYDDRVGALQNENARLATLAAIVEAMEKREVQVIQHDNGFSVKAPNVPLCSAPTLAAAYAQATGRTDAP